MLECALKRAAFRPRGARADHRSGAEERGDRSRSSARRWPLKELVKLDKHASGKNLSKCESSVKGPYHRAGHTQVAAAFRCAFNSLVAYLGQRCAASSAVAHSNVAARSTRPWPRPTPPRPTPPRPRPTPPSSTTGWCSTAAATCRVCRGSITLSARWTFGTPTRCAPTMSW
eukprot:scaffold72306_cov57-Phaeocystis_antarctica.AAC.1